MVEENKTAVNWMKKSGEDSGLLSKFKWFFQKKDDSSWDQKQRLTRAFHFTRRDSIISVFIAIVVIWCAVYYGRTVLDKYEEINSRTDELRGLWWYNVRVDWDSLSSYAEWEKVDTINWMVVVNKNIETEIAEAEILKQQQKGYYEVLLQNIYLPSLNVWKDPYTKNFDMWILWQKYLDSDKFQDLYLIQYWSDFAKYVWNDADYNTIDNINIWEKVVLEWNPKYFYTPITISFSSPNKRSFLLLVNKLSMTSNQNNIALLNEFFYHLLREIRDNKSEIINQLMQDYWEDFSSSSSRKFSTNLWDLNNEEKAVYVDSVIGYNLYHWINGDLTGDSESQLIDDDIIIETIKKSALCTDKDSKQKCFYNFREKYRNLPYLAYKIWLENQNNRTAWLLEFLQDLPPAIAITNFGFEKYSNSTFLNNKEEEYKWQVVFNAYGRNILDEELEEASLMLWKLCFWSNSDQKISPDLALSRVESTIISLWWYSNVSSLWELQWLFQEIKTSYNSLTNYDKMIKLFEIWRMMNDANLCNK